MQTFTGTEYLKIDIANCFGLDRLTWEDRIHWFNNNEPDLEALAAYAKNPILYRKGVRAMRKVQSNEPVNHIMGLDATASGLQIMAAMSGCHITARAVNLIDTGKRADVYEDISMHMNSLPGVTTTRDEVKKPIMTFFYGSKAQPKSVFGEETLEAFYSAMIDKLPGAYELMELFQNHWRALAEHHQWTLPDGHVAKVPVIQTFQKDLEIDEYDHMRFAYRSQVIAPKSKGMALAANIVHSLDGWIVRMMVRLAKRQGFWMAPIHDCFYASPNDMDKVRENYKYVLKALADYPQVSSILTEISGRPIKYRQKSRTLGKLIDKSEYTLS